MLSLISPQKNANKYHTWDTTSHQQNGISKITETQQVSMRCEETGIFVHLVIGMYNGVAAMGSSMVVAQNAKLYYI